MPLVKASGGQVGADMGVEVERKFLVANDGWRSSVVSSDKFLDGLLATFDGGKVRIRLAKNRAWVTIKGERKGTTRAEFEYEVSCGDALQLLKLCIRPTIKKTRHCVEEDGQVWSVDVYEGLLAGLTIAEIELKEESQPLVSPRWLGREITCDQRYSKSALRSVMRGRQR